MLLSLIWVFAIVRALRLFLHRIVTLLLEPAVTFTKKHYLPAKVGLVASNMYFFLLPFKHLFSTLGHLYLICGTNISIRLTSAVQREVSEALAL